ncbi:MAG: prepilin-type N-terminal cleavage/methylation domain-containing protein [Planctomycetales bacterium]|nr:prepilin-type N-terminal cleavage/methylation domain-containing protein [Planctomycetales bacterium]
MKSARGFTLIEVILALAILGAALAVIGECVQIAGRNSVDATTATRAQMLASSVMDEMVAGVREILDASDEPLEAGDESRWLLDVLVGGVDEWDMQTIEVRVRQDLSDELNPFEYRLQRSFVAEAESDAEAEDSTASSGGSTSTAAGGSR